ncbi:HpcH/HpaI aldolase/citrate lyase family protein [Sphingomonas sp. YL-JM2C]
MKPIRSFLFIPGDSDKKLAKADSAGADALILDLEDSVAPENKPAARAKVAAFLAERPKTGRDQQLWVRINPFDSGMTLTDLVEVMPGAPCGIMLPKAEGPADVRKLSHYLDAFEAPKGATFDPTPILPVATETARAPFLLGDYAVAALPRLLGLTWGAEDLSAALGATTNVDGTGRWAETYRLVRSLTLLGAKAAHVQAIDTLFVDFRDEAGLRASCVASRAEGFTGRIAIHPAQVAPINESYMPSAAEEVEARRIIAALDAAGGGTAALDGRMIDIPHRRRAEAVLAMVELFGR